MEKLRLKKFEAKIKMDNLPSIKMFTKMGFLERSRSEVFGEVTLAWAADLAWLQAAAPWHLQPYLHEPKASAIA